MQQQVYCAAQRTHAMMENQRVFASRLDDIERRLGAIAAPDNLIPLDGAQKADGAA